jgi:hypothetical protein
MSDKIETIDVGEVDWNATAVQYMELNKQKAEAIQRVRELHFPSNQYSTWDGKTLPFCETCDGEPYPCPTIKALDGDTATLERDDDHDSRREYFRDEDLG